MATIEDYISALPKDEQVIMKRLRSLILEIEPRVEEKINYGVPYFTRHRMLFFLWPGTISECGSHHDRKPDAPKVTMGFCHGNLLSNEQRLLASDGRKQVYVIRFFSHADINEPALREIIQEAVIVDQEFQKRKR
ncbi:MAG: DUF1801 domain-containing protein [Bacteroidota bacterium]